MQIDDARSRNVVWDADGDAAHIPGLEDAEGEPDPVYAHLNTPNEIDKPEPIGVREPDGTLRPWVPPPPKPSIIKSRRQEDRSVNFNSQTSTKLVRLRRDGFSSTSYSRL